MDLAVQNDLFTARCKCLQVVGVGNGSTGQDN